MVQEAYARAFKFFDSFRGEDARAWLLTIVRNTCYTWVQDHRHQTLTTSFDEEAHGQAMEAALTGYAPPERDPEALMLREADRQCVDRALEKLPLEFREILVLRELEELSYKQIAEIAGIPMGTVMSRLARARKLLGECLKPMNEDR